MKSKRGVLTKEIKIKSKKLLGYTINQTELRLIDGVCTVCDVQRAEN